MENYQYKDSNVYVKKMKVLNFSSRNCPVCAKYIKDNEMVYLVFNNHKYFPNVVLHESCLKTEDVVSTFKLIENKYEEYEQTKGQFKELDDMF